MSGCMCWKACIYGWRIFLINVADMALLLSVAEVAALDCAIAGFCAFVRKKVHHRSERDETLQDVERLREALARML